MSKHIWPKWLRYTTAAAVIAVGLLPLFLGPGLAEERGWERATGADIGALVGMVYFAIAGWISLKLLRKQARREVGQEVNRLLYPYRDEEDKGKP